MRPNPLKKLREALRTFEEVDPSDLGRVVGGYLSMDTPVPTWDDSGQQVDAGYAPSPWTPEPLDTAPDGGFLPATGDSLDV